MQSKGCENKSGYLGWICRDPLNTSLTIDHHDGDKLNTSQSNLKVLCANCHQKKTKEFGGGSGSGGGADLTKYTESGQCYIASLVYNVTKKEITWEDLNLKDIEEAAKYVDTGKTTLKDVLEQSPTEWVKSYVKVANYLFKNYKMKTGKTVYFHRDSALHQKVFKYKKAVMDADRASSNPQAPGSFGDDKWNPADIWMAKKTFKLKLKWNGKSLPHEQLNEINDVIGILQKIEEIKPPKPSPKFIMANCAPKYLVTNSPGTISIARAL